MARRRRHRRFSRSRSHSWHKAVAPTAFLAAFLGQLTVKDFAPGAAQGTAFKNADLLGKFKFLMNDVTGRISGVNFFGDATQFTQTINPSGMINKYVGLGLLATIFYPMIPKVPGKSIARKAGGALIAGGLLGGLFDDAPKAYAALPSASFNPALVPNTPSPLSSGAF